MKLIIPLRATTRLIIFLVILSGSVHGQNLVPNPSFEKFSVCPTEYDQVDRATPWQKYQGSPDYFGSCTGNKAIKIPKNFFGYAEPPTGGHFVGVACFHKNVPNEIIGVALKKPLQKGRRYKVGFKALLAQTYSGLAVSNLGILFTNQPVSSPQAGKAHVKSDSIINTDSAWKLVQGEFLADDQYTHLTLGMFYNQAECKVKVRPQAFNNSAYYFIDDIFVIPISDCPNEYQYTGKVMDEDTQAPLKGVVKYYNQDTETEQVSSLEEGIYDISLEDCYTYNIEIEAEGYYPIITVDFQPVGNKPLPLPTKMTPLKSGKTIILKNIYFDFNKATLKPASFFELNILAEILKKNKDIRVEISGHTDNVGTNDYNLQLSRQRALTVKTFLEEKGTPVSRLVTAGYGKTQPIADNATDEGRALNRRVEFKIL